MAMKGNLTQCHPDAGAMKGKSPMAKARGHGPATSKPNAKGSNSEDGRIHSSLMAKGHPTGHRRKGN